MTKTPTIEANHLAREMLISAAAGLVEGLPIDVVEQVFALADEFVRLADERQEKSGERP